MDTLAILWQGFSVSLSPTNFTACFMGILLGTFVGVMPSMGSASALALLMPICYYLDASATVVMLPSIYYGAKYGGAATSILLNIPGEASSIATCVDGHVLARKGRGGAALLIALFSSFAASIIGLSAVVLLTPFIFNIVIILGPPEYLLIFIVGLLILARIASKKFLVRSLILINIGIALSTVGCSDIFGLMRFTFGNHRLEEGINICFLVMGLFGVSRILVYLSTAINKEAICPVDKNVLYPNYQEVRQSVFPVLRGSFIGSVMGLLPFPSELVASFMSYITERRCSLTPQRFGKGMIAGVAGPEAAKNAAVSTGLISLLLLGMPFSAGMAMLLSGFMLKGISPGMGMMDTLGGSLFGVVIGWVFIANILLLIVGVPAVGIFVQILRVRLNILMPLMLVLIFTCVYAMTGSTADMFIVLLFGLIGFYFEIAGINPAPLLVGFVLGPDIEQRLAQSLIICDGNILSLLARPVFAGIIILVIIGCIANYYYRPKIGWLGRTWAVSLKRRKDCE